MHGDEPAEVVHDVFNAAMYPGHPLGRDVLGWRRPSRPTTRATVAAFHRRHYRTANIVVAAAGQIDHDAIVEGVVSRLDKAAAEIGRDVLLGGAPARPRGHRPPATAAPGGQPADRTGPHHGRACRRSTATTPTARS